MIYETIVIAGIILILIAIAGNKKIEFEKIKIGDLTDVQRSIMGVLGIIVLIIGIWQPFLEGDRINGVPTPTPTLTPTPTPTSILQVGANIATIVSLIIAVISLIISFYAKNKVGRLEIEINKIKGGTNFINSVIENLTIHPKAEEGEKDE